MAKTGTNEHFNYKFVTASDIKRVVSHLFAQHGLSLQMSGIGTENVVVMVETKDYQTKAVRMKEVPILRVQFSIRLCDVDTGAVEESFWFGEAGATDDKAASKAATSALKYFLISNLMIADKDEDKRDTDRDAKKRRPVDAPQPQNAPHWSMDESAMSKMYEWAMREHNATRAEVNKIVAKTGKTLLDLEKSEVMTAVKQWAVAQSADRLPSK